MNCTRPEIRRKCRRPSCLHPTICPLLGTDHAPLIELMRQARRQPGVKQLPRGLGRAHGPCPAEPRVRRRVGRASHRRLAQGRARNTAIRPRWRLMAKPPIETFAAFELEFRRAAAAAGKDRSLVPYFMAGHPGCDLRRRIELALYLKRSGHRPDKVQDFIPPRWTSPRARITRASIRGPAARSTSPRGSERACSGAFAILQAGNYASRSARRWSRPDAKT